MINHQHQPNSLYAISDGTYQIGVTAKLPVQKVAILEIEHEFDIVKAKCFFARTHGIPMAQVVANPLGAPA